MVSVYPIAKGRIHMPVYPAFYPHRPFSRANNKLTASLGQHWLPRSGDQLPFAVLFTQIFHLTAFKIFAKLIFHVILNVTAV